RKADGTIPVYLRITEDRKSRQLAVGIAVAERDWNPNKEEVRRSHPQHKVYNDGLEKMKHEAEAAALGLKRSKKGKATADAVKRELTGVGASHFFPYADRYWQEQRDRGKYWEWKKVVVLVGKIEKYHGSRDLAFS